MGANMDHEVILEKLNHPKKAVRMVLDTDTYNEVDDQFALAYALASPESMTVEAVYAAPFQNDRADDAREGMLKSYDEILRIFDLANRDAEGMVFRGSDRFLDSLSNPVESDAAADLIDRARTATKDDPLYVVAIGAITNVASALLLAPEIKDKIVVVWLGANPVRWPHAREFNIQLDPIAGRYLFDCGVPLIQVPCFGVTSHLTTTPYELETILGGKNAMCDALITLFNQYYTDWFGKSKELWDIGAIAYLVNEEWVPTETISSPLITEGLTWVLTDDRHPIKSAIYAKRSEIFTDMFSKLIRAF